MKNWWNLIKIRFSNWIRNRAAGSKIKHFRTLREMDAWMDKYGPALMQFGILRSDILSPILLSCIITPDNIAEATYGYECDRTLRDMLSNLEKHHDKWCRDGSGANSLEGTLYGVEVTQEDYYWILEDGQQKHFITGVSHLQVRESINENIIRYSYI